jgi:cell division septal protein FtsQ
MFGRRTTKRNQRGPRYELLNVELGAAQQRSKRIQQVLKWGGSILAVVALFFGVWFGGQWGMRIGFYQNEKFSIQKIDIHTDGVMDPQQIRYWAGSEPGKNLFDTDLLRVKRDLEMVPQVKLAAVDRVLPDTLRIRVAERRPVAQVLLYRQGVDGQLVRARYWVDDTGFIMPPLEQSVTKGEAAPQWLPMLMGLNQAELVPGRQVNTRPVRAALDLIRQIDLSPMAGLAKLREINVTGRETMEVVTWNGARIKFSQHGLDRQLRRWRQIFDLGRQHQRAIAAADLSIQNNLPVRWMLTARPSS